MIETFHISYLLIPFRYYNYLVGIIGAALIALSGEWMVIIAGIAFIILAYWIMRFLFIIPSLITIPAMHFYHQESKSLSLLPILFAILLKTSMIVLWCYFVFLYLFKAGAGTSPAYLLFAFSIINIPLNELALRNIRNGSNQSVYGALVLETMLSAGIFLSLIMRIDTNSLIFITGIVIIVVKIIQYLHPVHEDILVMKEKIFTPTPEENK